MPTTTTLDKIWLFSVKELADNTEFYGNTQYDGPDYDTMLNNEGHQYKLFNDMNVQGEDSPAILGKKYVGNDENAAARSDSENNDQFGWWTRSIDPEDGGWWVVLSNTHFVSYSDLVGGVAYGVSPGFGIGY